MKRNLFTFFVQAIGTVGHIFWGYFFVHRLGWGLPGLAIACLVTNLLMFFAVLNFTWYWVPELRNINQNKSPPGGDQMSEDDSKGRSGESKSAF